MLLIDVSTSYFFRHWNAMGILRTEHEVIRAFRDHLPGQGAGQAPVVFAIYHPTLRQYFRVDPAEMDSLLFDKSWEQPKPGRALDAISRPRATARQLRFLREIRALAAAGPDPTGPETEIGLARIAQDAALAQQMQRISLGEYSRVRRWLSYAARLRPSLNSGISRLDQINHLVHHGLFDAAAAQLFSRANLIGLGALTYVIHLIALHYVADTPFVWVLPFFAGLGGTALITLPITYYQSLMQGLPGAASSLMAVQKLVSDGLVAGCFALGMAYWGLTSVALMGAGLSVAGAVLLVLSDRNRWLMPKNFAHKPKAMG